MNSISDFLLLSGDFSAIIIYLSIIIMAFLETLFLVGAFFPGGVFVIIAGFLSAFNILNIWISFFFVILGGIFGDLVSYYFGIHGFKWFKHDNRFFKLKYIERGKEFFEKHGDKSLVLGRFMGFLKGIVPFVAGLIGMNFKKFIYLNIISGFLWTTFYLSIGFFLGKTMHTFYMSKDLKFFIFIIPFILLFVWILFESRKKILNYIKRFFNN